MIRFDIIKYGEYLGTRQLGEKVRNVLLPLIQGDEKVVLDFTGVQIVANSFADECLAKILLVMPLEELKKRTTFASLNELAQKNIVIASRRRITALESAA